MTYNPIIPNQKDAIATSQPEFLDNFSSIFDNFGLNHVNFNSSEAGNHSIVEFFQQKDLIQTNSDEYAIYSKHVDDQTTQLFVRPQGNGKEIQLTNYQIYSVSETDFFTALQGGFIIYFGQLPSMKNGSRFTLRPSPKNIIGVNFCSIGTATGGLNASHPAFFQFGKSDKDSENTDTLMLYNANTTGGNVPEQFYVIMGNFI